MFIWLASYPKSGNTLVRSLLASYFFTKDGSCNFEILKKINPPFENLFNNENKIKEDMKNLLEKLSNNYISYLRGNKSPYEMLKKEKDYDVVCFVNPPSLDDVFDIAEAGETMPQKSTYFFPKVYSGIVTRCLNK